MRRLFVLLAALSVSACESITGTGSAVPFEPPAYFRDVAKKIKECSGQDRIKFESIEWYELPGRFDIYPDYGTPGHGGIAVEENGVLRIIMAGRLKYSPFRVGHEILHLELGPKNSELPAKKAEHPDKFFLGSCRMYIDEWYAKDSLGVDPWPVT